MSVDTEITGSPASIRSAGTWLRGSLKPAVQSAGDAWQGARSTAQSAWSGEAGGQFEGLAGRATSTCDDLESAANDMAEDLDDFAHKLQRCQDEMETIRSDARGKDLVVTGFLILDPGPGPARPPDDFTGTDEQVQQHNREVEAYDAHQDKIRAYNHASSEASRIDRQYNAACMSLQDDYPVGQHASWIVTTVDILGEAATGAVGVNLAIHNSKLTNAAQDLLVEATTAMQEMQAHPERYLKRKWLIFTTVDRTKLNADRLAIEGKLSQAEDLLDQTRALDDVKIPRVLKGAGKLLGPLGFGLGVYNDWQEGESTTQIAVSQGVSTAAGAAAGAGATIGTAALTGAAIGSVVPGAGTAVGAVVGTVVGAGVAIFADGAIDSFFDNGPDVGKAWDEGVDALKDTGGAIADGVGAVGGAIGGLFD